MSFCSRFNFPWNLTSRLGKTALLYVAAVVPRELGLWNAPQPLSVRAFNEGLHRRWLGKHKHYSILATILPKKQQVTAGGDMFLDCLIVMSNGALYRQTPALPANAVVNRIDNTGRHILPVVM